MLPAIRYDELEISKIAARAYLSELLSRDGWSTLRAVKKGRVILLPKDLFQ